MKKRKKMNVKDELSLNITVKDFERAREALRKAHIPGPYKAIYNLDS